MLRTLLVTLLILLTAGLAQTTLTPRLLALVADNTTSLSPGEVVTASFVDAQGRNVTLPVQGRYALWVVDGFFALEERSEVPETELNPQGRRNQTIPNPLKTVLPKLPRPAEGQCTLVFFANLPARDSWPEAQRRMQPCRVLFDVGFLQRRVPQIGTAGSPEGLYLMEGQRVRHRYSYWGVWDYQGLIPLVAKGLSEFWAGRAANASLPLSQRGSRIPAELLRITSPTLLIRIRGDEAEAPKNGIRITLDASGTARYEFLHPGSNGRFLLETLPALLRRYKAQGVALVYQGSERIPELQRTFMGWTFVPMRGPEDRLAWLEQRFAVVRPGGEVVQTFVLVVNEEENIQPLEQALQQAR